MGDRNSKVELRTGKVLLTKLTQVYRFKPTPKPYDALLVEKISKKTYATPSHKSQLKSKMVRNKTSKFCRKKQTFPPKNQRIY